MEGKPCVALYSRVSTLEQWPEIQLDALRSYAGNRGLERVAFGRPGCVALELESKDGGDVWCVEFDLSA